VTQPTSLTMGVQGPWQDPTLEDQQRVEYLVSAMTLREKVAQLYGVWVGAATDGGAVAPHQDDLSEPVDLPELIAHGLGQLTRPFGTAPVDPAIGRLSLARAQREIVAAGRFGIPAIAHEECLAGFTAWGATIYPVPLSWGATFNPELIEAMAAAIGASMRLVGVHQGLAPVLDVVRDPRWGRTEETIAEDPYLVGSVGSAYVRGLESAGIVATLKHFVGYSASKAGRNLAPVSVGTRELQDVLLVPFEMAVRDSGVRSVMHSYADIDGVPVAASRALLTTLLRDTWGFKGTVVADYFGIAFLKTLHGVAEDWGDAARLALTAGVDIELPTVRTFGPPLIDQIESGAVPVELVDRALRRVLHQKLGLGLLDAQWHPEGDVDTMGDIETLRGTIDLDPPAHRALARQVAEQAAVLLKNDGILPLDSPMRIALIGPCAADPLALLGCYSFPSHVGSAHPELPLGVDLPTLAQTIPDAFPASKITCESGCDIASDDTERFELAVSAARASDVVVVALGDRAGLFGRGTSGEGCDVASLELPGVQGALLDTILDTGATVVLVLQAGRPYALGRYADRCAAIIQTFFPGEEGARAIARILSGVVNPSGRLPISVPRTAGAQPATYLGARLAQASEVSSIDPTALYGFGHGLGYSSFEWSTPTVDGRATAPGEIPQWSTDGQLILRFTVRNTSMRAGTEVVQVYLHDPVGQVVRPVVRMVAYQRIVLEPSQVAVVTLVVPADVSAFTGLAGHRVVEPGALEVCLARSSADQVVSVPTKMVGAERMVDHTRALHCAFAVTIENRA
jgi:beta-xylosidase